MRIIVGLGNPGEKYAKVRHNLGFMVADHLVDRLQGTGYSWEDNKKLKSLICNLKPTTYNLLVAKPQTYMNNSGLAVKLLTTFYSLREASKLPIPRLRSGQATNLIVIHDDLDLPLGKIKVRLGGAAGGHHGVESIINALGTDKFIRLRLGIGNLRTQSSEHKQAHVNTEKFVLEPFMPNEKSKVKHMIKQAVGAIEILLEKGLDVAQNQYN